MARFQQPEPCLTFWLARREWVGVSSRLGTLAEVDGDRQPGHPRRQLPDSPPPPPAALHPLRRLQVAAQGGVLLDHYKRHLLRLLAAELSLHGIDLLPPRPFHQPLLSGVLARPQPVEILPRHREDILLQHFWEFLQHLP